MTDQQLLEYIKADSKASYDMQMRRHPQWDENYLLYRDKITTNRLTQRQAVNVPLIRETIQTWISKIDEAPLLQFEAKGKDNESMRAEIVINELYMYYYEKCQLELVDNLLKKIVGLQGRCFMKVGWSQVDNAFFVSPIDPYDVELDPRVNPFDLESARFFNHKHIFKPLREILANKSYEKAGKDQLVQYLDTKQGILRITDTVEAQTKRDDRLRVLGVNNFDEQGVQDVPVELKECYKKIWVPEKGRFVWHLVVQAMDHAILYRKPLIKAIGVDFLPILTWADDPDINDPWNDGKADSVRTFNKITNIYISQMLENRTYRNFGMFFYDSTNQRFTPNSVDPRPFGMYPLPGKPGEVLQQMKIEPLDGTVQELGFLKDLIQSSVAITPNEQGLNDKASTTLGEVKINLAQSKGRLNVTAKNYRSFWKLFGFMFYEIICANAKDNIVLFKKGPDDQYYPKDIYPSDWQTKDGFNIKVVFKTEHDEQANSDLQKAQFASGMFKGNPVAEKISKRKILSSLGWKPDEIQQVMDAEDQMQANAQAGASNQPAPAPQAGAPMPGAVPSSLSMTQ